jgi:uncharacterized membrane protein
VTEPAQRNNRFEKGEQMLAMLAAILIALWLLGFMAFHITTGFIHIVLVVGLVMLVLHFLRGGRAAA